MPTETATVAYLAQHISKTRAPRFERMGPLFQLPPVTTSSHIPRVREATRRRLSQHARHSYCIAARSLIILVYPENTRESADKKAPLILSFSSALYAAGRLVRALFNAFRFSNSQERERARVSVICCPPAVRRCVSRTTPRSTMYIFVVAAPKSITSEGAIPCPIEERIAPKISIS